MTRPTSTLLERFEGLRMEASSFRHRDHILVAYAMLDQYEFVEACARYASTIRTMAESVGAFEKYNTTITLAFLSLIAERKAQTPGAGPPDAGPPDTGPPDTEPDAFLEANPDLLDPNLLDGWYTKERLDSPAARAYFLLPDKPLRAALAPDTRKRVEP